MPTALMPIAPDRCPPITLLKASKTALRNRAASFRPLAKSADWLYSRRGYGCICTCSRLLPQVHPYGFVQRCLICAFPFAALFLPRWFATANATSVVKNAHKPPQTPHIPAALPYLPTTSMQYTQTLWQQATLPQATKNPASQKLTGFSVEILVQLHQNLESWCPGEDSNLHASQR